MILVAKRYEAERLQASALKFASGREHFCHSEDRTRAGVKGDLDKIAWREFLLNLKKSAGHGNELQFRARVEPAFRANGSRNRSVQVEPGRTPVGVGLGEVCHSRLNYAMGAPGAGRLPKRLYAGVCLEADKTVGAARGLQNNAGNFREWFRKSSFGREALPSKVVYFEELRNGPI